MKGVLVILDGIGDRPSSKLNGGTPLQSAEKPNLDAMAERGRQGYLYPISDKVAPESDTAIVAILGNNPNLSARGVFEALGAGIEIKRGDLALRTNFATIDNLKNNKVIDRRAGRTLSTKEAKILGKEIDTIFSPRKFVFQPTVHHRGVLVLRGGFSDNITNTDPAYMKKGGFQYAEKFKFSKPLDEDENSQYTANIVNDIIEQSFKKLDSHPINEERRKKGLFPANIILTRDPGVEVPKLNKMRRWMAVQYMPLEIGICKVAGMQVFSFPYPDLKGIDVYKNLYNGLDKAMKFAIKTLKKQHKNFDYAYLHFKETDIPGHDNKPQEKKNMIEVIDKKFFSFLKKFAEKNNIKVVVTADHSTPCSLKAHSSDPVPVLVFDPKEKKKDEGVGFSEKQSRKGKLGRMTGKNFLKKVGLV